MKKLLALILALTMLLSLGACTRRPGTTPTDEPQDSVATPAQPAENEPENTPATPAVPEAPVEETEQPEASPAQPTESAAPDLNPEPSEIPESKVDENSNDGKIDSSATVSTTATDLAPADDSFVKLIPELPYDNWASSSVDANTIMLQKTDLGSDAQAKLLDYVQLLRDANFAVNEYVYGSLYKATSTTAVVTIMLEGGILSVTIEKV